jgi:HEAT repeat protein
MQQLTQQSEEPSRVALSPAEARPELAELEKALRRGRRSDKVAAAGRLREWGPAAVPPLCEALRDRDLHIRVAAADALGEVGDERAIPALVRALKALFPAGSRSERK